MSYKNISYVLPQEDLTAVNKAFAEVDRLLPFLVNLDSNESRGMFKLGPKSADFVQDSATAVNSFPNVLPPSFDKEEFLKDATLFRQLMEIKFQLDSLCEKVNDTLTAVGSEAMTSSLEVYAYVQTASDRTPGLKSVADKLKDRFKEQGKRKVLATTEV